MPYRGLILGEEAAGKTALLYRMKLGEEITTVPTIGFNVETVQCGSAKCDLWDLGGKQAIKPLWRQYYSGCDVLIYCVDSSVTPLELRQQCDELRKIVTAMIPDGKLRQVLFVLTKCDRATRTVSLGDASAALESSVDSIPCQVVEAKLGDAGVIVSEALRVTFGAAKGGQAVLPPSGSVGEMVASLVKDLAKKARPDASFPALSNDRSTAIFPLNVIRTIASFSPEAVVPRPDFLLANSAVGKALQLDARAHKGALWLVSKTLLHSALECMLESLAEHLVLKGGPMESLLSPAVFYLQVPPELDDLHALICGLLLSSMSVDARTGDERLEGLRLLLRPKNPLRYWGICRKGELALNAASLGYLLKLIRSPNDLISAADDGGKKLLELNAIQTAVQVSASPLQIISSAETMGFIQKEIDRFYETLLHLAATPSTELSQIGLDASELILPAMRGVVHGSHKSLPRALREGTVGKIRICDDGIHGDCYDFAAPLPMAVYDAVLDAIYCPTGKEIRLREVRISLQSAECVLPKLLCALLVSNEEIISLASRCRDDDISDRHQAAVVLFRPPGAPDLTSVTIDCSPGLDIEQCRAQHGLSNVPRFGDVDEWRLLTAQRSLTIARVE